MLLVLPLQNTIGFFHPFTNDGGGGERVLWCVASGLGLPFLAPLTRLRAPGVPSAQCRLPRRTHRRVHNTVASQAPLLRLTHRVPLPNALACPQRQVYIFTGDDTPADELCARASTLFGVPPLRPVRAVRLRCRGFVLPERYPLLTLLGQSLGSMVLGLEALWRFTPALFIDTAGYAFTYPLARCAGARVACYTHYPMVSTDMLAAVASRAPAFNNRAWVARSAALSALKARYYRALAALYGAAGRCADAVMVNSSWTEAHIAALWRVTASIVYPPCDIAALRKLPLSRAATPRVVISVAQFRPEKAHAVQLRAWAALLVRAQASGYAGAHATLRGAKLILVGGVRNAADAARLGGLRSLAASLGIESSVEFQTGIPAAQLRSLLGSAHAGLHTMRDEHFGISVVEYMAAGAVPIAHNSAGPREDIIVPAEPGDPLPGRLAASEAEYTDALEEVLCWPEETRLDVAARAREASGYFSEEIFASDFIAAVGRLLPRERTTRKDD